MAATEPASLVDPTVTYVSYRKLVRVGNRHISKDGTVKQSSKSLVIPKLWLDSEEKRLGCRVLWVRIMVKDGNLMIEGVHDPA